MSETVHPSDRVPDPAELPPRPHLDRALAELDRTDPWDVDRERPAEVDL